MRTKEQFMPGASKQGVTRKGALNTVEIAEIARLIATCDARDNLHTRISVQALRLRSSTEINDFLYYERGQLAGYLSMDNRGTIEKEMTGIVRPESRRRGIFRQLFEAAREECLEQGVSCMVLVCEQSADAGHAFIASIRAHREFSEHEMFLASFRPGQYADLRVLPATEEYDAILLALLAVEADEVEAHQLVEEFHARPEQQFYLATLAGGEPLGCLCLEHMDDTVRISNFVIHPAQREHGYGRAFLETCIHRITTERPRRIMLEVETTNERAIRLYQSCGFSIRATYDYFKHPIYAE
jgi:ribosomal protein S18 acetylase RimI-like enzyme